VTETVKNVLIIYHIYFGILCTAKSNTHTSLGMCIKR